MTVSDLSPAALAYAVGRDSKQPHPASLVTRSLDPSPNLTTLTPVFLLSSHMFPVSDPDWDSQAEGNFPRSTNRLGGAVLRGGSSAQGRGTPDNSQKLRHKGLQKQPESLKSHPHRPTDPPLPPLHWQHCHSNPPHLC